MIGIKEVLKEMASGIGKFGVSKIGIYKIPYKRGEGRHSNNTIPESEIPRKVYYHFIEKPETDFPNPTFIFAYASYPAVVAIFRALVGADNDSGIARVFKIREELNRPIRYQVAQFLIYVELIDPHPDFLSLGEAVTLMEHLMLKYGRALTIERVDFDTIINI